MTFVEKMQQQILDDDEVDDIVVKEIDELDEVDLLLFVIRKIVVIE